MAPNRWRNISTTACRSTLLNLIATLIGAAALVLLSEAAARVVQLAPVHVVAPRAAVVSLRHVDIVARRVVPPVPQVVRLPAVEVTAKRAPWSAMLAAQALTQRKPI